MCVSRLLKLEKQFALAWVAGAPLNRVVFAKNSINCVGTIHHDAPFVQLTAMEFNNHVENLAAVPSGP